MNQTDLIDVSFVDNTNYASSSNGDIVGIPIEHCWGPANTKLILNRTQFLSYFPESQPVKSDSDSAIEYLRAWANAKRALDMGASYVEVVRLQGNWNYIQFNLDSTTGTVTAVTAATQFSTSAPISIAFVYPGYLPKSLGYDTYKVSLQANVTGKDSLIVKLYGVKNSVNTLLEELHGGFIPEELVDGQEFYLPKVLLRESSYLRCVINSKFETVVGAEESLIEIPSFTEVTALTQSDYITAFDKYFSDSDISDASLLISPMGADATTNTLVEKIQSIAKSRMDCVSVVGYPISSTFSKDAITTYLATLLRDKFSLFIAGREKVSVCGKSMIMDCTAGWCGRAASVAKSVRLNQLPSARTYGLYSGVLTESLQFADVLALHELGVISVYNSSVGTQIFGIRSLHDRQTSYFAKANVSRVLASILSQVFPLALSAVHTDTASNDETRAIFESNLQSILDQYITTQNIKSPSNADVGAALNTDTLTQGGKILNVVLNVWFIGLVEKIKIKIVATDSSVTAEITQ